MKTSAKEQIVNMFKDVSRLDNCEYTIDFQNISVENFDPPAYIVRIIFIDVLGLPDYGRMDKVHWHTIFNYKGKTILIRDYKFGTWSVESKTYDESTKEVVSEIMEKIKIASNSIDKVLYEYLKYYVHNGNFYIKNMNNSLASIFYFYLGKTQGAIDDIKNVKLDTERKEVDVVSTLQPLTDLWNKTCKLTEIAFHYTYSMIHAFYSYLEFIFDVVYAQLSLLVPG